MTTKVTTLTNHVPLEGISIPRGRWALVAKKPAIVGGRTYDVGSTMRNGSGSPKTFADRDQAIRYATRTLEFLPDVWMASDRPAEDGWHVVRGLD